jgi:PAS domain S-box-containing protein
VSFDNLASGWAEGLGIDRRHFNMFFEKMMDGFAYHKIIVDSSGKPVDYVFLEMNTAFENLTGLKRELVIGKNVTEVLKGIENDPADWIGMYGKVALTGEPAEFESFSEGLGKWFKVTAYSPQQGYFVALFEDITKRKEAEQALAQSEQRWATTLSSIGDAVIATDINGKITFMNDVAEQLTGWTLNQASLKSIKEVFRIINEKTRLEVDNPIDHVLKEDAIVGLANHTVLLKPNGTEVPIDDSGAPIRDRDGKTTGVVLVFRDITERRQAEQERERLSAIVESTDDAIIGKTLNGIITSWNLASEKLYGYTADEMIGKPISLVIPEDHMSEFQQILESLRRGERIEHRDTVRLRKDGSCIDVDVTVAPIKDRYGEIVGASTIARDITERKKFERKLKTLNDELEDRVAQRTAQVSAERQRLYNVLETLPSYVILLDRDHHVTFANKVFRETFGEDHGRRCHEYLFNKNQECDGCITYNVLRETKPQHWYWTGPNGHDYDIYDYPFKEADGSTLILEMGIDITERKKAEVQALEAAKKLKDAERLAAIGATAGMVGHDIRNPLQAITGDVFLAKGELESLSESEAKTNSLESLGEIEKNVDYINKIVQDLQDFARPLNPKTEETDVKQVIDNFIKKSNSIPKNVKIDVQIADSARKIMADTYYLNRILYNLITNSVQAMPQGGKIHITATKGDGSTVLTVEDTGPGIPQEVQAKMFTLMFTTKAKGQGFGLPVVKRMIESLGGTVTFTSQEGKGTIFIVRLPNREPNDKLPKQTID